MSADGFAPTADSLLVSALVAALRADADVQSAFGSSARVYEEEPPGAVYPFAYVQGHQTTPSGSALHEGRTHTIAFIVKSRHGGRMEARALLGVLQAAAERAALELPEQRVVLVLGVYADAMRARNLQSFRGLLRLRLVTEEAD